MNKVGIYFAYWTSEWKADYSYYIDKVKNLGFDVLEVCAANFVDASEAECAQIKSAAKAAGIELTFCLGASPEYDISAPDVSVRNTGIEYMKRVLEVAYRMGVRIYGGINYACWPVQVTPDNLAEKNAYRSRSLESLRKILPTAEDCGVYYCVEVVNRFEQFLLNTAKEALLFCEDTGSRNAKILLDTFHMNIEEDSITDAILTAGDRLGHLHIGETNRKTPGTGRIPWNDVVRSLHRISYEGAIVMEPFIQAGGTVGKDICVWREFYEEINENILDEKARRACTFIKSVLESVE